MAKTADIVIIGAGSTGSSIAYHLAKMGMNNIIVLDKLGIGSGATGHAAGLIRHHYPNRELVRMVKYCSNKLENFHEEMNFDIDHVKNEFCYLTSEGDKGIIDMINMQKSEGVNVEILQPKDVENLHPKGPINTEGIGYGLLDHDAAYSDPYKVAVGYIERAKDLGVDISIGVDVKDIIVENRKVVKVVTNKGDIATNFVINAAGVGAVGINKMVDINMPLKYMSLGHGVLLPDIEFDSNILTINDGSTKDFLFFLRPESGGTVLIGMDQDDPNREIVPESYYMDVSFDKFGKFYEYLIKRLPFVKNFKVQTTFGALDLRTPDWNPGIGHLDDGPDGYYLAIGGSGHCFKLAPVMGKVIAESILGRVTSFDFSMFDVNRISQFCDDSFSGSFFVDEN